MFESFLIILLGFALLGLLYYRVKSKTYQNILDMTEEEGEVFLATPGWTNNPGTHTFTMPKELFEKILDKEYPLPNASNTSDLQ